TKPSMTRTSCSRPTISRIELTPAAIVRTEHPEVKAGRPPRELPPPQQSTCSTGARRPGCAYELVGGSRAEGAGLCPLLCWKGGHCDEHAKRGRLRSSDSATLALMD